MSLADDMRAAASTLEKASHRYGYLNPSAAEWCPETLRREAEHVESEDTE